MRLHTTNSWRLARWALCLGAVVALIGACILRPAVAGAAGPPDDEAPVSEADDIRLQVDGVHPVKTAGARARESGDPLAPLPFGGMELLPIAFGMVALAKDRNTPMRDGKVTAYPVAADAVIYAGALVVANGGFAEPGTTAAGLVALGRANEQVDNTDGADGDLDVLVERGVFLYANDGSITEANIGGDAYIVDDQTVAATDGSGTRSLAGVIRGVEVGGVWVEI